MAYNISKENERLMVIVPKTLKKDIEELADKDNRSMSNFVRCILEDYVKKSKGTN